MQSQSARSPRPYGHQRSSEHEGEADTSTNPLALHGAKTRGKKDIIDMAKSHVTLLRVSKPGQRRMSNQRLWLIGFIIHLIVSHVHYDQ
jgi:hypothetical protein